MFINFQLSLDNGPEATESRPSKSIKMESVWWNENLETVNHVKKQIGKN